jgi:hypothetical protein
MSAPWRDYTSEPVGQCVAVCRGHADAQAWPRFDPLSLVVASLTRSTIFNMVGAALDPREEEDSPTLEAKPVQSAATIALCDP